MNDKPNPSWNLDYARSLTLDQWTDELNNHFLQKIDREVRTFPFREPVRSIIETLSLENDEYANWYVHSVSFSADSCDFPTTALTFCSPQLFTEGRGQFFDAVPVLDLDFWGEEMYVIVSQAVLHINDAGEITSEILDAWADVDCAPDNDDSCLSALVG